MLGFTARADAATPLHPAEGEIEQAVWATRAELQAGFRAAHAGDFDPVPIAGGAAAARPADQLLDRPADAGSLGVRAALSPLWTRIRVAAG